MVVSAYYVVCCTDGECVSYSVLRVQQYLLLPVEKVRNY